MTVCHTALLFKAAVHIPDSRQGRFPTIREFFAGPRAERPRPGPLSSCRRTASEHANRHTICSLLRRGVRLPFVEGL